MFRFQLAFRSAQRTLFETKAKIRELLHIPEVLRGGNTVFTHLVQELEDTVSIYLRKTVEKHSVTKNYEVNFLYNRTTYLTASNNSELFLCSCNLKKNSD